MGYIGLENYIDVLNDKTFWRANFNTLLIVFLSTFVGLPISLVLALTMDRLSDPMRRFFKASSVFPRTLGNGYSSNVDSHL